MRKLETFLSESNAIAKLETINNSGDVYIGNPKHSLDLTLRIFVDFTNGNDSNDGLSWSKAKKSISSAISDYPKNNTFKTLALILRSDTDIVSVESSVSNINFPTSLQIFKPTSTIVLGTDHWSFFSNDESVTFNNSKISISGLSFSDSYANSYFEFESYGDGGKRALKQFVFLKTLDLSESNISFSFRGITFDFDDASNWGIAFSSSFALFAHCEFLGGSGDASTNTGRWAGAIRAIKSVSNIVLYGGSDSDYEVGFTPTVSGKFVIDSIAQLFCFEDNCTNSIFLELANLSVATALPSYCTDNFSSSIRSTYSTISNIITFSKGIITYSDVVTSLSLPTSDPSISGALWSDSGTVKVSAG